MKKRVTIIILTWNGLHYTRQCLKSLRKNTAFEDYDVIVSDNGSQDGTPEYIRTLPWVKLIENGSNLGFVKGNNVAIRQSDPESDVLLLNNDTEIEDQDWLSKMQETAYKDTSIGIVGCRLKRPNGILQHAGTYMPKELFWGQQIGSNEKDIGQYNRDREVEGVVFACVYIKREVLNTIGLLDEDYFSYFEDTDYCLKAKLAGYKVYCCGSTSVIHLENTSAEVNQVRLSDFFFASQKIFKRKWEAYFSNRYQHNIAWHSLINFPTGYSISSRKIVEALDSKDVEVSYKYVYGEGTVFPLPEPEQSDSTLLNLVRKRSISPDQVQVVYAQGDVFQSNFGKYKIGFTMLETDHIPAEWVRQANLMDEVWVTSSFNEKTFRDSGVTRPIYIVPLGVDPNYFNPDINSYRPKRIFTFLSIFEWGERKAPEILLKAFNDEFSASEDVVLICKTSNSDASVSISQQVSQLGLSNRGGQIIFSINDIVPTYQLGVLYRSADCFVLPTRGEGWGMPILEAMACGLPVIATNWSSQTDFMNEQNAYPLQVEKLIPAIAKCPYYTGFKWAEPSYEHLRYLMRYVYEHREEAEQKGLLASQEVLQKWTWDNSAQRILDRLVAVSE